MDRYFIHTFVTFMDTDNDCHVAILMAQRLMMHNSVRSPDSKNY